MRTSFYALLLSTIAFSPALAPAQMGHDSSAKPAPGTISTPAKAFDSQLSLIEGEVMGAVKAMPADRFSFAPTAAIFAPGREVKFDGVRTFAQQAAHIAEANYFFGSFICDLKPDMDPKKIESLSSKDDIVAALSASFAYLHRAFATLTPANSFEVIQSPEPGFQTRGTMASFAVSHTNDHYGQMVEYLRMNGLVPPASAR